MSSLLSAEFSSYRKAQEAAYKLLAIRAENIGIALADRPAEGDAPAYSVSFDADRNVEFADELPPWDGDYRLTAAIRPEAREQAVRIVTACGGRMAH